MATFAKNAQGTRISDRDRAQIGENLGFVANEQYKLLRTNLKFTIPADEKCPVIGVTSSKRMEGKSTTSINLAYVLAEEGNKVLLMDGDLRLPSIGRTLGIKTNDGLTDLLMGGGAEISQWRSEVNDNWYILTVGKIPPNPSELLSSKRMADIIATLKENFDYIVLDLPPVNIVSDALAVSNLITGLLFVIRENYTTKKDTEHAFRQIKLSNVNVLGCVLNDSTSAGSVYTSYRKRKQGYYYRSYRTAGEEAKGKKKK